MERRPESLSEGEEELSRNWLDLPREVTESILEKLDAVDIFENVQRVCTQWESICRDPSVWRTIIFRRVPRPHMVLYNMFIQAVELSCGGLINFHLIDCGTDKLLDYVTQRCTEIRRLRLVRTGISDVGLCEAAKRLPLLEDLEISYCNRVSAEALSKLGECCPLLKSLKMNRQGEEYPVMDDSQAVAISEHMVELRHLQLFGNRLTNKGLTTILDSCSHLESLDLRQCFNINLDNSSLGKNVVKESKIFGRLMTVLMTMNLMQPLIMGMTMRIGMSTLMSTLTRIPPSGLMLILIEEIFNSKFGGP